MRVTLGACTATPFGGYLKALGVLRLVAQQSDGEARGWWDGETFVVESKLSQEDLFSFFLSDYSPTPIVAPWNGGSGFYPNDNKDAMDAIASSTSDRFGEYRDAIAICRAFPEVIQGKGSDEDSRRGAILRRCRNLLGDRTVDWLDAAVGIAADGSRAFAPVLGTGGNEGRLDYTNNFMSRVAGLLIAPDKKTKVDELLANALIGTRTTSMQPGAAGQYDPGRAGGANQGPGVEQDCNINPWDLVLTLEGAVAWASGLYRRQGVGYRPILCSPFTVRSSRVGYSSAGADDDSRAEIWTPLWRRPVRFDELSKLLREGRASVQGRPANTALEFAEAASSLGVDRSIDRFVRYSLLKRRGDSYVALPAGIFPVHYRTESDRIREFQSFLEPLRRDMPKGADDLYRNIESAVFQVLLTPGSERMRELMAALGRYQRRIATTTNTRLPTRGLKASTWVEACGWGTPEVRIAAALASIYTRDVGSISENLMRGGMHFAWNGPDLPGRLVAVLDRRLQTANAKDLTANPLGASCEVHPGDATLFIEGSVDDLLIEDLLFAFVILDWTDFEGPAVDGDGRLEVLPIFAILKHLFLPREIKLGPEAKRLRADPRVLSLLRAGAACDAAAIAVARLRIAGLRPLDVVYEGGVNAGRLAAALLIPVWAGKGLAYGIFHDQERTSEKEPEWI